jgi:hypothetical protein
MARNETVQPREHALRPLQTDAKPVGILPLNNFLFNKVAATRYTAMFAWF